MKTVREGTATGQIVPAIILNPPLDQHTYTHFLAASSVTEPPGASDITEHQVHLLYESLVCVEKIAPQAMEMTGVFSFIRGSPVQIIVYRNHSGPVAWRENTYSQSNKHNPPLLACSRSLSNNH